MTEPDELYTLRAQYWLGHYGLAVEEAKSVARRPMSPALKAEREEFLFRAMMALGQRPPPPTEDTPALRALVLKAKYEATHMEAQKDSIVNELKTLQATYPTPAVQLFTAHVLLQHGQTKEALSLVHLGATMEQISLVLQIYLKMDRVDLAQQQWRMLQQADEDAVLTQLASVYVHLAQGQTGAADALHTLTLLSEQYGGSPLLLNLMACAFMLQGEYPAAEAKLQECLAEFASISCPDTYLNLICCSAQQNKPATAIVQQFKQFYPHHPFCASLERVTSAFDREAIKYKV